MANNPYMPRSLEVERIDWSASALKPRTLPATVYKGLFLNLVLTTTNDGAAALTARQLAQAIAGLKITLAGQDVLVNIPGEFLYVLNNYDFSKSPPVTIDLVAGAGKVQKLSLYLPFALTRAVLPEDTLLDARKFSSVIIDIQWCSATGIGTDITITSGYLEIQTDEYNQVPDAAAFARHEFGFTVENLTSTGTLNYKLDYAGNNQYKRLFLMTKNAAGADANTEINKAGVKVRSFYYLLNSGERIQNENEVRYAISPLTGIYVLDFTRDGKMTQRLDARTLTELFLEVNCAVSGGLLHVLKEKAIYRG